ncbi:MAG: S8 family serine peptidase [Micrococcales bacterium]|nr:S8 family serine peptidase [Micrococcales bacterium]
MTGPAAYRRGARRLGAAVLAGCLLAGSALAAPALADTTPSPSGSTPAAQECKAGKVRYDPATPPALVRLGAERAWTMATGAGVTVAVVDSGVNGRNGHFSSDPASPTGGRLLDGTSLVPGTKWATEDLAGHGTAAAGIIAAGTREDSGVVGLARDATILPVRVYADESDQAIKAGMGPNAARLAQGIRYAASHGARIINVSMSTTQDLPELRSAVQAATASGSLVVASAGNLEKRGDDDPVAALYPGAYPEVLTVAAAGPDDAVTDATFQGPHVDVSAPGSEVLTTFMDAGDCVLATGAPSTSWATAYASAAAALVAQRFPSEKPAEWKHRLEATASRPQRDRRDDATGWGLIQPTEALTLVDDGSLAGPAAPGRTKQPAEPAPAQQIDLRAVPDPERTAVTASLWWALAGTTAVLALTLLALLGRELRARRAARAVPRARRRPA